MRKRAALVAVWVLGTLGSIALAWTAVSRVGGEVTSDAVAEPSSAAVVAESTSSTTATPSVPGTSETTVAAGPGPGTAPVGGPGATVAPSPSTPPATTAPPPTFRPQPTVAPAPASTTTSRVFEVAGGSAGVQCTGDAASLQWATPRSGYEAEVHDSGPARVEVRFRGEDDESRIRVSCAGGTPVQEGGGSGSG